MKKRSVEAKSTLVALNQNENEGCKKSVKLKKTVGVSLSSRKHSSYNDSSGKSLNSQIFLVQHVKLKKHVLIVLA